MPYLQISNVSKSFGTFQALKDVSLEIEEGKFVCFLGPSGCGKTTLLRAIAGLDIQTSGRILQGGRDISALPSSQRDFGIVFQSYALFPNLSIADNIGYGLKNSGKSRKEVAARVAELTELVGLKGQERKYPSQLSGGQQQRVALARAIAMAPGLLLLDEPLSALDARVRLHLRSELKSLQRRIGVTTIMVTHDQAEALAIADQLVVMNQGVIEQVGTPQEVYRNPKTAFVADFVGHMNFLRAEVVGEGNVQVGGLILAAETGGLPAGEIVSLCFRPEDIQVRGIAAGNKNTIEVRIEEMEFLGTFYRADLALNGPTSPRVMADFSMNAARDLALEPGKIIPIAMPADRLRLFGEKRG
ncbi:putative 2-aminoethylphosphonate ABC transporter ATP-binding protein [Dongia sedimenti]|uniref:2-aminoethylphosphonate ABC transporter ATP-binding protein n=1 Tax=Dongia sedimenti TaxID=3064282 RepID=A0ABU0YJC8_9PROT|nr:putative 2-aminoethylphosphonate ABC transporter ATP-binding protein [Rhodospirillaceae bacterium R-7]